MSAVTADRKPAGHARDRGRLARDLSRAVRGEVRFDPGSRALYANDASVYRQVPTGVVIPRDAADVLAALEVCRAHDVPVFARGCGTGLAGQSVNAAVVFDFSKYMNKILELDPDQRTAVVQPGVICDQLRDAAAPHGLTTIDPATHSRCTLGGMIGNNSCGTHSVIGGKTVDNVLELDVVTYDGTRMTVGPTDAAEFERITAEGGRRAGIYRDLRDLAARFEPLIRERYPQIPRRVSGYNLDDLLPGTDFNVARALVGSESTCVLVLAAKIRLIPDPPAKALLVIGYPDAAAAGDHVPQVIGGDGLTGLESFDGAVVDNIHKHGEHPSGIDALPEGAAWLLAEYGGATQQEANRRAETAARGVGTGNPKLFEDPQHEAEIWEVRRSGCEYTRIPGDHGGLPAWEDAAVPPERLGDYLRSFCDLLTRYGYRTVLFGHFGQGCVHTRLNVNLHTEEGIDQFRHFLDDVGDLVVSMGGSLSGEHGDGQLRANQLHKMFGTELVGAFAEFKRIWDPAGRMNPGKVVAPYRPDQNLRWGADYQPRQAETYFAYPEDEHGFADAVNRCFGIGRCRHTSGGTMCPSFMATREEQHSTRGRARLLFEMANGHLSGNGWREPHVKEALDLCLSCKGCKSDCPVGVDIATYKAEFLAHYYQRRIRPRQAYALGLIPVWARLAARAPGLVNAALSAPVTGRLAKAAAGVEPSRSAPGFAATPFRSWFEQHASPPHGDPVLLWPDTFTSYFAPEAGIAAVEVLEQAGYRVQIPDRPLCCGRPLYDYGMLKTARRWLRRMLDGLREPAEAGLPVIGLEPSCLAVFRDELPNMFPADPIATRLARQSVTLGEFLSRNGFTPPRLNREALVQVHCHHGAVFGYDAERQLLEQMGLRLNVPDSGCCGMAGSFGFERGQRYQVSRDCGERVILPAVRDAPDDALIIADGFSCREQIAQATGRRPLHLAQVLQLAGRPPGGAFPEHSCWQQRPRSSALLAGLGLAASGAMSGATALAIRRFAGGTNG